jgi:hypothetical protein
LMPVVWSMTIWKWLRHKSTIWSNRCWTRTILKHSK